MSDWYYLLDQEQKGPVPEAEIRAKLEANELPPDTFVWQEGLENWMPVSDVPNFAMTLDAPPASILPPLPDASQHPSAIQPLQPIEPVVAEAPPPFTPAPQGCVECHSPMVVPGFATPLCQPCRDRLIRRPIPLWLKIAASVMGLFLLFALTRVPRELSAAVACERGKRAEDAGDHAKSLAEYQKALAYYPDAPEVIRGIATAAFHAGDQKTAVEYANKLIGPTGQADKGDVGLINEIRGGSPP